MRKFYLLTVIMLAAAANAHAQQKHITEIPIENGERWWGTDMLGRSWDDFKDGRAGGAFFTDMMVSSAGRYLWSAEPMEVATDGRKLTVASYAEKAEVQKGGKTLREAYVVCVHKNLTAGRQTPASELLTRPVYRPSDRLTVTWGQREIMDYARTVISEGLPAGIVAIPEGWCSPNVPFTFQQELFPDPEAMIRELHGMGFGVMLTVTPRTPSTGRIFSDAYLHGWIVTGTESRGWSTLDMGDRECFASFRRGFDEFRARYAFDGYLLECAHEPRGSSDPFTLNWERLAEGIGMCVMTGVYERPFRPYVSQIGGGGTSLFADLASSSLSGSICNTTDAGAEYADDANRAAHMIAALFFPVASVNYEPWAFGERVLSDRVKAAVSFRASLAGYMENLLRESARTGEPIVRHMEYQFPRQGFTDCDTQFMLGPGYLIVPYLGGGTKCMVRLPKGRWADRDGNRFKGPVVMEADCTGGAVCFELLK